MNVEETEDRIVRALIERAATVPEELKPEMRLSGDLGLDSLDLVDLAMEIEEKLSIPLINQEQIDSWRTVGDLMSCVLRLAREAEDAKLSQC